MTKYKSEAEFNALPLNERLGAVLEGTFYYASVHAPNARGLDRGYPAVFTVKVGLDAANEKKAIDYGLRIKEPTDDIPEKHVEIKRKIPVHDEKTNTAFKKDGTTQIKIDVVDGMQNVVPPSILIGNGSKGFVKFGRYWYPNNGGGIGTALLKMQVTELVPYTKAEEGFVMQDNGFNVSDMTAVVVEEDDVPFDADDTPVKAAVGSDLFDE